MWIKTGTEKRRRGPDYLANPAGMFHGQASTGHRCSYIPFQVYHNGSHGVEAPWTIFLHHSKERSHMNNGFQIRIVLDIFFD